MFAAYKFNRDETDVVNRMASLVKVYYNIASKATQSNSVYVSVLKIPIVLADGVSKSLRQKYLLARQ